MLIIACKELHWPEGERVEGPTPKEPQCQWSEEEGEAALEVSRQGPLHGCSPSPALCLATYCGTKGMSDELQRIQMGLRMPVRIRHLPLQPRRELSVRCAALELSLNQTESSCLS